MEFSVKQKVIAIIVILVAITGVSIYCLLTRKEDTEYSINDFFSTDVIGNNEEEFGIETEKKEINNVIGGEALSETTIVVHITGEIIKPGIIELKENARIADAIDAAGGVTTQADLNEVNLAFVLSDGQKIYIPNKSEKEKNSKKTYITSECGNNVIIEDNLQELKSQKVNINEANKEKLEELPGIGPSIAQKIIEYRNQIGKFTSIEQLLEVSGIGEAKYAKIKDSVVVKK